MRAEIILRLLLDLDALFGGCEMGPARKGYMRAVIWGAIAGDALNI